MKHKGNEFEYKTQRDNEILMLYRRYVAEHESIRINEMLNKIINSPSSRFWISECRAAIVIGSMLRGVTYDDAFVEKKEMYDEIFKRALAIWEESPNLPISVVSEMVVEQRAPKFYMSESSALLILSRAKKKAWEIEKRRKLHT